MRLGTAILSGFLFCVSLTSMAWADSIRMHGAVPGSGTPAGGHNPPCSQMSDADDIIDLVRDSTQETEIGPITAAIADSSYARNRLQVMLGVHNGPSMCRYVCGVVPRVPTSYEICVDGHKGKTCRSVSGNSYPEIDFDYWAYAEEVTWRKIGDKHMSCFLVKNWKHDYARNFVITIYY